MDIPRLPLAAWLDDLVRWMQFNLDAIFNPVKNGISAIDSALRAALYFVPSYAVIAALVLFLLWRKRFGSACWVGIGLALIVNLGLWHDTLDTCSLMLPACGLAILIGGPLGILIAESRIAAATLIPALDYMQATPAFVYLIPAVLFFGIGATPGVLATAAFALPPVSRAVALGLREVKPPLVEAGTAFGATRFQILLKVKLPLSRPYIVVGINQCIMMALSMVVICALIGAGGLGVDVVTALAQMNLPQGIEAGVAVVLLAMALDRTSAVK